MRRRRVAAAGQGGGLFQPASATFATTSAPASCDGGGQQNFGKLVLLRHGQSAWNRRPNEPDRIWRYAGTVDIPLSPNGVREAVEAGKSIFNDPAAQNIVNIFQETLFLNLGVVEEEDGRLIFDTSYII